MFVCTLPVYYIVVYVFEEMLYFDFLLFIKAIVYLCNVGE